MTFTIGQLKDFLDTFPDDRICKHGFYSPHSFRGYYDEAAVVPCDDVTIAEMKAVLDTLLTDTFVGWKGGDFNYNLDTPIHFSKIGYADDLGQEMAQILLSIAGFDMEFYTKFTINASDRF
jgi:hypothetical protein